MIFVQSSPNKEEKNRGENRGQMASFWAFLFSFGFAANNMNLFEFYQNEKWAIYKAYAICIVYG